MLYQHISPSPQLQAFVKRYLLIHFVFDKNYPIPLKPYPARLEQCLTFNPQGFDTWVNPQTGEVQRVAVNALFGQPLSRHNFQHVWTEPEYKLFKVFFQPGALFRLLGLPLNELTDGCFDSESVIGQEVRAVNDRLANATTQEQMVAIVEAYLLKKVSCLKIDAHPIHRIAALLEADPARFSLDWLSDQACLSPRQFNRKFTEQMGIGPKLYSRIARYYQAFRFKQTYPQMDWLTIALQYGYTDVQHLAKDFKQFAGVTPNQLLQEERQSPERILLLTE